VLRTAKPRSDDHPNCGGRALDLIFPKGSRKRLYSRVTGCGLSTIEDLKESDHAQARFQQSILCGDDGTMMANSSVGLGEKLAQNPT